MRDMVWDVVESHAVEECVEFESWKGYLSHGLFE